MASRKKNVTPRSKKTKGKEPPVHNGCFPKNCCSDPQHLVSSPCPTESYTIRAARIPKVMLITVNPQAETNVKNVLMEMQMNGELCDFVIKSGAHSIQAHKCILAASLQYFRTSFHFSEVDVQEKSINLSHLNCEGEVIEQVIKSLYSNQLEVTAENISNILCVADYLMHSDLVSGIEKFMFETLGISTAALYFQLCIQYGFDKGDLFHQICFCLSSRLHDHLLHQPSSLDWSTDVMEAMLKYNLFNHCTPLQMTDFILKKLERLLDQVQWYGKEELNATFSSILCFLEMYITHIDIDRLNKWCDYTVDNFKSWMAINAKKFSDFENVCTKLSTIQNSIMVGEGSHDLRHKDKEISTQTHNQNTLSDFSDAPVMGSTHLDPAIAESGSNDIIESKDDNGVNLQGTERGASSLPLQVDTESLRIQRSSNSSIKDLCHCLVVLSPSREMVSQLMEIEAKKYTPLLTAPQLSLHFYDIGLGVWRNAGTLNFPVRGHMTEKHCWRMAYVNQSLFLFSITKEKGLEYNIASKEWSELDCESIFKPHIGQEQSDETNIKYFPVKSVIPISMSDSLVVLSMSREIRPDMTFWTQQHIYQWDPDTRTFCYVTHVVDERLDVPTTKWTVEGDLLVTVKASKIFVTGLDMFRIQHIHVYNAKTKTLKTHRVECFMRTGLKVFLRNNNLHLHPTTGAYRVYNLENKTWGDWSYSSNDFSPAAHNGHPQFELLYPAGMRSSCPAGNSRWTLNSNFYVDSASLSEYHLTDSGELIQRHHPNPPFLYMTVSCSARINQNQIDSLEQAMHQPLIIKNH